MKELSGDIPLSWRQKIWYVLYNTCRGFFGLWTHIPRKYFYPKNVPDTHDSLFRKYVDAFLQEKVPTFISTTAPISIFDIGCGTGYARSLFSAVGYSGTYHGVDVVREQAFDTADTPFFTTTFEQKPISDVEITRTYDLVVSNTSLEHIPDDMEAVQQAHRATGTSGVEVHIVPAFWSLYIYLWHGFRQFTPRRLHALFLGTQYVVYPLGGLCSLCAQFVLGTIPERFTGRMVFRKRGWYPAFARTCIRIDRFFPVCPMGYAIVVFHGAKK